MQTKNLHSVVCLVAFAAHLLNMAAAAGGAVVCQGPAGESAFEMACEHDHCAPVLDAHAHADDHDHHHDADGCRCSSCPCEDTPVVPQIASRPEDEQAGGAALRTTSLGDGFMPWRETRTPLAGRFLCPEQSAGEPCRALRHLRTVVLIV